MPSSLTSMMAKPSARIASTTSGIFSTRIPEEIYLPPGSRCLATSLLRVTTRSAISIRYDDVRLKVNALGQISVLRGSDSLYMIQGDVFAGDCHRVRVDLHAKHFRSAERRAPRWKECRSRSLRLKLFLQAQDSPPSAGCTERLFHVCRCRKPCPGRFSMIFSPAFRFVRLPHVGLTPQIMLTFAGLKYAFQLSFHSLVGPHSESRFAGCRYRAARRRLPPLPAS